MRIWKSCVTFYIGGFAYLLLELLWRGWTDGSMFLAGGLCFLLLGGLNRAEPRFSLPVRAVVGAGIVTMVELAAGMAVNRSYGVWDYRDQPGNFMGQICPMFSLLWIPVSLAALELYDRLEKALPG